MHVSGFILLVCVANAFGDVNPSIPSPDFSTSLVQRSSVWGEPLRKLDTSSLPYTSLLSTSDEPDQAANAHESTSEDSFQELFESMRYSVVRVQATIPSVNYFQPYQLDNDVEVVGSAWAVNVSASIGKETSTSGPVFLTNAHVVRNARTVKVQLPIIGQRYFDAYVPAILNDFDLAAVRLKDPHEFAEVLGTHNIDLHSLTVSRHELSMGLNVAAVGFPLGSSTLKLSSGIISGTEPVNGNTCYQSTAPISPGSSGGPLFALHSGKTSSASEVVGVNFASSADKEAQNANYVIHSAHILQLLHELHRLPVDDATLLQRNSTEFDSRRFGHVQVKVAPLDVISIEANEALYEESGCKKGVFLSHIPDRNAFNFAAPPVKQDSFLEEVNGIKLDSFGMGVTTSFLKNPISFTSIMTLPEHLGENVTLKTCANGETTEHVASLHWRSEYVYGIGDVLETLYEPEALLYEIFDGVTIMQMDLKHIDPLLKYAPSVGRWLLDDMQNSPRLLVTHVKEGSYAGRILGPGMVIATVNDGRVNTLDDLRKHFVPKGNTWRLKSDRGITFATRFREAVEKQYKLSQASPASNFLMTPAFRAAAISLGYMQSNVTESEHKTALTEAAHASHAAATRNSNSVIFFEQRALSSRL